MEDKLTPEEEKELAALEAKYAPKEDELSPEEEKELAELEAKHAGEKPGVLEAGARGLADGLTFGFAPEISGAVESAFTDKTYEQAKNESKENFRKAEEAHPIAYGVGEYAPLVLGGAGLAKAGIKGAAAAGKAAMKGTAKAAKAAGPAYNTFMDSVAAKTGLSSDIIETGAAAVLDSVMGHGPIATVARVVLRGSRKAGKAAEKAAAKASAPAAKAEKIEPLLLPAAKAETAAARTTAKAAPETLMHQVDAVAAGKAPATVKGAAVEAAPQSAKRIAAEPYPKSTFREDVQGLIRDADEKAKIAPKSKPKTYRSLDELKDVHINSPRESVNKAIQEAKPAVKKAEPKSVFKTSKTKDEYYQEDDYQPSKDLDLSKIGVRTITRKEQLKRLRGK